jgi:hypothetical protein
MERTIKVINFKENGDKVTYLWSVDSTNLEIVEWFYKDEAGYNERFENDFSLRDVNGESNTIIIGSPLFTDITKHSAFLCFSEDGNWRGLLINQGIVYVTEDGKTVYNLTID